MIRTCGTWFRKPLLYPLSYGAVMKDLGLIPTDQVWALLQPSFNIVHSD